MNQTFSPTQIIKSAWDLTKKNIKTLLGVMVVAWIIQFVPNYIQQNTNNGIASTLISLVSWILNGIVTMFLIDVSLKLTNNQVASIKDITNHLGLLVKYLIGSIYYSVIVGVGLLLLVVPGVIWALRYQFFGYLIIDQGLGIKDALSKSKEITQGNLKKLFVFGLLLMLINVAGALLLGLGLLITIPLSLMAVGVLFRQLTGVSQRSSQAPQPTEPKTDPSNMWKTYRQTQTPSQ
ncbi:hypothetical protein ACFL1M_02080 [Patescibacteria group bacterium]